MKKNKKRKRILNKDININNTFIKSNRDIYNHLISLGYKYNESYWENRTKWNYFKIHNFKFISIKYIKKDYYKLKEISFKNNSFFFL